MPISRQKKETILKDLNQRLGDTSSVVFVNFHGVSVAEATIARRALREKGCSYIVAKKTLIKKALSELKTEGELPELKGEVALSYGNDPILPAQGVYEFTKKYKDHFVILGGVFEKRYITADEVIRLAQIPSREVLLGQLLNVMQSPISGFAGVLNNTIGSFVRVLNEVAKVK